MAKKQNAQNGASADENAQPKTTRGKGTKAAADTAEKPKAQKEPAKKAAAKEPAKQSTTKKQAAPKSSAKASTKSSTAAGSAATSGATTSTMSGARSTQASDGAASRRREPSHDEIARRAYELYQQRGGQHGSDADDWLRAERELRGA